jgi:F-type H+-transporting ATPase subunit delta
LYELLDRSSVSTVRAGLKAIADGFSTSATLKHALVSPAFGLEAKNAVLAALSQKLGCPPVVSHFLSQLLRKNRIGCLPEIADAFAALADAATGKQPVSITAAAAVNADDQAQLRQRLQAILQQDVELTFHEDPRLLSGLQIRIGSLLIDGTVRGRLTAMQTQLTKE